jgi:hypothetical protein
MLLPAGSNIGINPFARQIFNVIFRAVSRIRQNLFPSLNLLKKMGKTINCRAHAHAQ